MCRHEVSNHPFRVIISTMVLIERAQVGAAALARMRRDGVVVGLSDDAGVARDVPSGVARGCVLVPWVPRKAAVTGLAALWCYGLTLDPVLPGRVNVVVPRGAHPDPPPGIAPDRWGFTTHQPSYLRSTVVAGVRIVTPADAVAAALHTESLGPAVTAAYTATKRGIAAAEDVHAAICQRRTGATGQRALHAWRSVYEALEGR